LFATCINAKFSKLQQLGLVVCSGRFNGGGGGRAVLTSEFFFNKAPFPRIKDMHVLVCICDK